MTVADFEISSFGLQALVILTYCSGAAVRGLLILHAQAWTGFFPVLIILVVIGTRLGRN